MSNCVTIPLNAYEELEGTFREMCAIITKKNNQRKISDRGNVSNKIMQTMYAGYST
jgi:hypothetical protein